MNKGRGFIVHIMGVSTGVQFEQMMIDKFRQAGLTVHDTPASNDYGADLIIEYNGHRIAVRILFSPLDHDDPVEMGTTGIEKLRE